MKTLTQNQVTFGFGRPVALQNKSSVSDDFIDIEEFNKLVCTNSGNLLSKNMY